jgi:hypothetical protein
MTSRLLPSLPAQTGSLPGKPHGDKPAPLFPAAQEPPKKRLQPFAKSRSSRSQRTGLEIPRLLQEKLSICNKIESYQETSIKNRWKTGTQKAIKHKIIKHSQ